MNKKNPSELDAIEDKNAPSSNPPENKTPEFTREHRFKIMSHIISKIAPGIYIEPIEYKPLGVEGDIEDVLFTFFIHIPVTMPVIQYNQENRNIRTKRTFVCLFVEPPKYSHIRENVDMRIEVDRFTFWKREILKNQNFKNLEAFC